MAQRETVQPGRRLQQKLGVDLTEMDVIIPGYKSLSAAFEFGELWQRGALTELDSITVVLTCLMIHRNEQRLEWAIETALREGHEPRAIVEIFLQAGIYAGFPAAESAASLAKVIFDRQQRSIDQTSLPKESLEVVQQEAERMKQQLHGALSNKDHADLRHPIRSQLYPLISQFAYGEIWRRPGLLLRYRLITAIVSFVVIDDKLPFYKKFSVAALNNGFSIEELSDLTMQTVPYSGGPRALKALAALECLV